MPSTASRLRELAAQLHAVVAQGPLALQKELVRSLVAEIRVHRRDRITPRFRVPQGQDSQDSTDQTCKPWLCG
jgi:hypothetical protein